jgi:hypothetical protein
MSHLFSPGEFREITPLPAGVLDIFFFSRDIHGVFDELFRLIFLFWGPLFDRWMLFIPIIRVQLLIRLGLVWIIVFD